MSETRAEKVLRIAADLVAVERGIESANEKSQRLNKEKQRLQKDLRRAVEGATE